MNYDPNQDVPTVDALTKGEYLLYQKEFEAWIKKVHDVSKSNLSKKDMRIKMCELLNGLSEKAYITYFQQIVYIIQRSKEKCQQFRNTEEQVNNILSWLPRLNDHKELLTLYIKERRQNYKLTV